LALLLLLHALLLHQTRILGADHLQLQLWPSCLLLLLLLWWQLDLQQRQRCLALLLNMHQLRTILQRCR
jgi:hypothetical protein